MVKKLQSLCPQMHLGSEIYAANLRGLLFISSYYIIIHHKIRVLRFASRQRQKWKVFKFPSIQMPFSGVQVSGQWSSGWLALFPNSSSSSCFVLLSLLACLGCTEKSVRLASITITSTPRSVNDVEVRWICNLLVDQGQ